MTPLKPQAVKLMEAAKDRAVRQIRAALPALYKKQTYPFTDFSWRDDNGEMHTAVTCYAARFEFRLADAFGERDVPLFFDRAANRWEPVWNMHVEDLARCADILAGDVALFK